MSVQRLFKSRGQGQSTMTIFHQSPSGTKSNCESDVVETIKLPYYSSDSDIRSSSMLSGPEISNCLNTSLFILVIINWETFISLHFI